MHNSIETLRWRYSYRKQSRRHRRHRQRLHESIRKRRGPACLRRCKYLNVLCMESRASSTRSISLGQQRGKPSSCVRGPLVLVMIQEEANVRAMKLIQLIDVTFSNGVQTSGVSRPNGQRDLNEFPSPCPTHARTPNFAESCSLIVFRVIVVYHITIAIIKSFPLSLFGASSGCPK